jgi:hypothetical protein
MLKLTEHYTVTLSRQKLYNLFVKTPEIYQLVLDMNDTDVVVFAALCDAKSITNSDYDIGADYSMIRLSAILGRLRAYLPITTVEVVCLNEMSKPVKRNRYMITADDLSELISNASETLQQCEQLALHKKNIRENQDINRLVKRYGEAVAAKRILKKAYGGLNLTLEQWEVLFSSIDDVCAEASALREAS